MTTFVTMVRGVFYKNPDGTDMQKIIKKCIKGEEIDIVREPDTPYNFANIGVFRKSGEQIGYISKDVAFRHPAFKDLIYYIDNEAEVSAKIIRIVGRGGINCACVIEISIGTIPWQEKEEEAKELITEAKLLENSDPYKAIELCVKAIKGLHEVDQLYQNTLFYKRTGVVLDYITPNAVLRKTRVPINRLSLVLEKNKKYKHCLNLIEEYKKIKGKLGLNKGDMESIRKRKDRMIKKLS